MIKTGVHALLNHRHVHEKNSLIQSYRTNPSHDSDSFSEVPASGTKTSTTTDFVYTQLAHATECLRLLKLLAPTDTDSLHAELIACRREDAPPYQPISYTWGQQDASSHILLRNQGTETFYRLSVRPNLYSLLKEMNRLYGETIVWVDAICINQNDDLEKSGQVQTMDKVYRDKDLLIWLGDKSENSDRAFDLLDAWKEHVKNGKQSGKLDTILLWQISGPDSDPSGISAFLEGRPHVFYNDPKSYMALFDLLWRPWFYRRWIVQEFVLSRSRKFHVGSRQMDSDYLVGLVHELRRITTPFRSGNVIYNMFLNPLRTTVSDHQGLDPLEMLLRLDAAQKEVQSGNELQLTLQRLLIDFGVTVSSDPRDSIYAFLSLANDIDVSNWTPDYSQINPPLNLFIKALAQIVDRTGSIDAICRHRSWSHPSIPNSVSWLPWFGSVAADCRSGHTHLIHFYHDKSLTTFHQPWKESRYTCPCCDRTREFRPHRRRLCCQCCGKVLSFDRYDCAKCPRSGYCSSCATSGRAASTHTETWIHPPELRSRAGLPRVLCDGCDMVILGTGLTCMNCDNFDYCLKCVKTSQTAHDPSHRFEFHDGATYFASGRSLTSVDGGSLEAVARHLFQRLPGDVLGQYTMPQHFHIGIGFRGFIVDKIRALGTESPSTMPHDVNNPKDSVGPKFTAHPDIDIRQWATLRPQIPIQDWAKLPGMKELTPDEHEVPGPMFYRALTGNRRILDGKIGHLTDEMIEQARVYYNSDEPDKQCAWNVHESVEVMLQNKRKFATTNKSLGFVPKVALVGDSIAILEGCSVPIVIREAHHRPRPDFVTWHLIGECYIEGLMEGEYIEKLASQDEVWSEKLTMI